MIHNIQTSCCKSSTSHKFPYKYHNLPTPFLYPWDKPETLARSLVSLAYLFYLPLLTTFLTAPFLQVLSPGLPFRTFLLPGIYSPTNLNITFPRGPPRATNQPNFEDS
jgi:hypothetical protein